MRKIIAVIAVGLFTGAFFSSCTKSLENRLSGTWDLDVASKRLSSGTVPFTTGYENGIFHLDDNGQASYVEGTDTLTGYWRAGKHNKGIFSNDDGTWQARDMRYLLINVSSSLLHRSLEWRFDDIHLYNNGKGLRTEQFALGHDRVYEFKKR